MRLACAEAGNLRYEEAATDLIGLRLINRARLFGEQQPKIAHGRRPDREAFIATRKGARHGCAITKDWLTDKRKNNKLTAAHRDAGGESHRTGHRQFQARRICGASARDDQAWTPRPNKVRRRSQSECQQQR